MVEPSRPSPHKPRRLAKDALLMQLSLLLMRGEALTHERLRDEFLLERRSAERRLRDLRDIGLPLIEQQDGKTKRYLLDQRRAKLNVEAIDVPPKAARALSLLVVAARLLPSHLGVQDAIDRTVRAAMRLRGMKASAELKKASDAVLVLENEAKDYQGKEAIFQRLVDAVLDGQAVHALYQSPRKAQVDQVHLYCASIGLYKGGLYVLGVPVADVAEQVKAAALLEPIKHAAAEPVLAHWYALERFDAEPTIDATAPRLPAELRLRLLDDAKARWGPATRKAADKTTLVTLRFSARVAPYVRARRWHDAAEWEQQSDGSVLMSIRLGGEMGMFENWLKSWGAEVAVLRPAALAERLASEFDAAASGHRAAAAAFARSLEDE